MLEELSLLQHRLRTTYARKSKDFIWPFRHLILASRIHGIYNLGGDLELFKKLIISRDVGSLTKYAHGCIELLQQNINNLELPITMVALVQGSALGGGFETALSCDTIIAERSAQMGFPEILFNLFPGMGAYNLLTRRVGASLAERIILSGKTYTAEELYQMGIVDVLAEDGDGVQATYRYLSSHSRSHNTIKSIKKIRQIVHPITEESLYKIVDIWVESAMDLSEKDLDKMEKLLQLQKSLSNSLHNEDNKAVKTPRRGDWRKIEDVSFPLKTHLGEYVLHNRRQRMCRRNSE
jgi:DSF synthase